ncbi:hypothetical protein A6R70_01135 [Agrobacterium rubi]|nr:hypothetical protein [Agrobacterium rubi]OCJ54218.1 hypothetical protein A6U92_23130 [Agrobacterium rubi]
MSRRLIVQKAEAHSLDLRAVQRLDEIGAYIDHDDETPLRGLLHGFERASTYWQSYQMLVAQL